MIFKHPANNYTFAVNGAFGWSFLFGCFYFLKHKAIGAAVLSFIISLVTCGIGWLFIPFFAKGIVKRVYLKRGFVLVSE